MFVKDIKTLVDRCFDAHGSEYHPLEDIAKIVTELPNEKYIQFGKKGYTEKYRGCTYIEFTNVMTGKKGMVMVFQSGTISVNPDTVQFPSIAQNNQPPKNLPWLCNYLICIGMVNANGVQVPELKDLKPIHIPAKPIQPNLFQ